MTLHVHKASGKERVMKAYNIYMAGVGGQGIGLLSEILLRAADHAGYSAKAVDTHGLAQRGGIVVSQLRIGEKLFTPLISGHDADLVLALERHEALRAMNGYLKDGGALVYYDTVWQPLEVRLKEAPQVSNDTIQEECRRRGIALHKVFVPDLPDTRMQNIVLLAHLDRAGLIESLHTEHFMRAMDDLMAGRMLQTNVAMFRQVRQVA
jgi:indolepyruvate ferredoxin oxidoreductase, beta subunit